MAAGILSWLLRGIGRNEFKLRIYRFRARGVVNAHRLLG
jgi:hypothetical protein